MQQETIKKENTNNYPPPINIINKESKKSSKNNIFLKDSRKSSRMYNNMDYFNEKFENEKDKNNNIIMNLRNKIKMLENKTNRLQSMNEVFLDLLKKQDRSINNLRNDSNNFYLDNDYPRTYNLINNFKHRYNELESSYPINEEYSRPRLRKSNSQLDMFSMKDIKFYKEPIKLMQEQLKAYIFQTTLDRRRQEYLLNEQINDIKSEVNNRLLRLENQQRLQLASFANYINNGGYNNNFDSIANRLTVQQRERENFEEFMNEKLRGLISSNNRYYSNDYYK